MKYVKRILVSLLVGPIVVPLFVLAATLCLLHEGLETVMGIVGWAGLSTCWVYQKLVGESPVPYSEYLKKG